MPVVTHYQIIESTPAGNGTNYVRLRFALDTGDVLDDGVRFIAADADLAAHAAIIGPLPARCSYTAGDRAMALKFKYAMKAKFGSVMREKFAMQRV